MITLPTLSTPICIDYFCVLKQVSILYMCYIHAMHLISLNYSPEQFCVLIRGHVAVVYSNYDSYSFALLLNKQHQQSVILRPVNWTCTAIRAGMAPELKKINATVIRPMTANSQFQPKCSGRDEVYGK